MSITLDHCCICSLEGSREPHNTDLRNLAAECQRRHISIAVYGHLPLENQPKDERRRDFAGLRARLDALGIGHIATLNTGWPEVVSWLRSVLFPELVPPPDRHLDVVSQLERYIAWKSDEQGIPWEAMVEANYERTVQGSPLMLYSKEPPPPETLSSEERQRLRRFWDKCRWKWNNKVSDVLVLSAHIFWAADGIFVTENTKDFQSKIEQLRARVPQLRILMPAEALAEIRLRPVEGSLSA